MRGVDAMGAIAHDQAHARSRRARHLACAYLGDDRRRRGRRFDEDGRRRAGAERREDRFVEAVGAGEQLIDPSQELA